MEARLGTGRAAARDESRPPRRVPLSAWWREHAPGLTTGVSWMAIGILSMAIARVEGLPIPSHAERGAAIAWLVSLVVVSAGTLLVGWSLLRGSWWARLQRHGRMARGVIVGVRPIGWLSALGRAPVELQVDLDDESGGARTHRLRVGPRSSRRRWRTGDRIAVVYSPARPEELLLHWSEGGGGG